MHRIEMSHRAIAEVFNVDRRRCDMGAYCQLEFGPTLVGAAAT